MTNHKLYIGSVLDALKLIASEYVNTVVTSPPYYGLRDYGVEIQPKYLPMILNRTGLSTVDMWKKLNVDPIHSLEIFHL